MKLDILLLKPYLKSICLVLLVPILITFFTGTLFDGLSFASTVMAMTTGYTFSITEKNSLDRFYGFLPVKRKYLVIGRYMTIFLTGLLSLLFTIVIQTVILRFRSIIPSFSEIFNSLLICSLLFSIYAGVQIPGYYRFGSIKGKMFMFIPTVGFLLFYYIAGVLSDNNLIPSMSLISNPVSVSVFIFLLIAVIITASAYISIRIVKNAIN